jgi:hypothetical protein
VSSWTISRNVQGWLVLLTACLTFSLLKDSKKKILEQWWNYVLLSKVTITSSFIELQFWLCAVWVDVDVRLYQREHSLAALEVCDVFNFCRLKQMQWNFISKCLNEARLSRMINLQLYCAGFAAIKTSVFWDVSHVVYWESVDVSEECCLHLQVQRISHAWLLSWHLHMQNPALHSKCRTVEGLK